MKLTKKVISILLVMSLFSLNVFAEESEISSWAQTEVNEAIENRFVPEELKGNYQDSIKRYEYVLLALQMLKRNGDFVQVANKYPFDDIDGHKYESEIIEAYNAGLINGYGDGTFRPDATITRQEIAALLVNLTLRIDPVKSTFVAGEYEFEDVDPYSWSKEEIDYCYDNGLIKGVGSADSGLTIIEPLGKATIEQSIMVMNRFGIDEGIDDKFNFAPIEIINDGIIIEEAHNDINEFAQTFGELVTLRIKADLNNGAKAYAANESYGYFETDNGNKVVFDQYGDLIVVTYSTADLSQSNLMDNISKYLNIYGNQKEIENLIEAGISELSNSREYELEEVVSDSITMKIQLQLDPDNLMTENQKEFQFILEYSLYN